MAHGRRSSALQQDRLLSEGYPTRQRGSSEPPAATESARLGRSCSMASRVFDMPHSRAIIYKRPDSFGSTSCGENARCSRARCIPRAGYACRSTLKLRKVFARSEICRQVAAAVEAPRRAHLSSTSWSPRTSGLDELLAMELRLPKRYRCVTK